MALTDPWTIALWLLILPLTGVLAIRALVRRPALIRADYPIFLFIAFNLLSLVWAAHDARAQSVHWLGYLGIAMGLYFGARDYCATQSRALLLAGGMLSLLVLFALINLLAWKWTPLSAVPSQLDGRGSRLMGATSSAAILSTTVAFLMVFCLLGLSRQSPRWLRSLALVAAILGVAVVAFGNTRSAIIGLGLAIIVALWVERRRLLLVGLGALTVIAMLSPLGDRFLTGWRALLSGANPTTVPGLLNGVFRLQLWSEAVKLLWHPWTPFVGDGIGTTVIGLPPNFHTHSELVQVWLETGTIGLGLGIWIYVSLVRHMLAAHEALSGVARTASLIGVCAVALAIPNFAWFVVLNSQVGWFLMIGCAISVSASDWGHKDDSAHAVIVEHPARIAAVREFWDSAPCGSDLSSATHNEPAYFDETAAARYRLEPHIKSIAQFERFRDRDVLEIGCGIGADGASFAAAGARYTGVDLSPASVALTQARFDTLGLAGTIRAADAESLPFENSSFDHVYSFGVIHHSPNTAAIVDEMHRVLRPGGTFCVMVYNKSSINYYVEIMGLRRAFR